MCGFLLIASLAGDRPLPHDRRELDRLRDTLRSRGPDAGETWINANATAALMHRRLKVIDLEGGRQPMSSADGRFHLVYNGEIYNYRELRRELEADGHVFRTRGDTEVLLAAYIRWRADCVGRLNGIFAFAVWDADERSVFAARDHCGVKPLYHGIWKQILYVASEAKAIIADPRIERRLSPEALDLYFHHGYVPAPWAIWRGMHKLEAAHRIRFELGADESPRPTESERYWQPPFGRVAVNDDDRARVLEQLDETLRQAVRRQTVSDVPLGAFLSGGTDSSLIVSYLSELSSEPVNTFSVGFEEQRYDERPFARAVAEHYSTRHHELVLRTDSLALVSELSEPFDEPFCDPAGLPTALVSRLAREHVTVALSGDGGDETHAGYRRYLRQTQMEWIDRLPTSLRRGLIAKVAALAPSWKRRSALEQLSRDLADRYDAVMHTVPWDHRASVYQPTLLAELAERHGGRTPTGAPRYWRELLEDLPSSTALLDRLQAFDLKAYLPEQLMTKTDRASMNVSLEVRVPFLDLDAISFAARVPAGMRIEKGRTKPLLRELLARRMGEQFANRKKHGFQVPMAGWFRRLPRERLQEVLVPESVEPWLDRTALTRLLLDSRHGLTFAWPFAVFAAWQQRYQARP